MNKQSITQLKGIGEKTAALFAKLDIKTMDELVVFFPYRYIRYESITDIDKIEIGGTYAIKGSVMKPITTLRYGRHPVSVTQIKDDTGTISVSWFNMPYLSGTIHMYDQRVFVGQIALSRGKKVLSHPKIYSVEEYGDMVGKLSPVYNLTAGLGNNTVCKAVKAAMTIYKPEEDYLPSEITDKYSLIPYDKAIRMIHSPASEQELEAARHRLVFDDFFLFMYYTNQIKKHTVTLSSNYTFEADDFYKEFIALLPYTLTDSQVNAIGDINKDISSGKVCNRLLQGDVGSGKTVVAISIMYETYRAGYQSAIMVPTEILARQHYETITQMLSKATHKPSILLLTGSMTQKEKRLAYEQISNHSVDIIIGTHALISEGVNFDNLAVVITDEQHRFGVAQRGALGDKGQLPHTIVMSATPIPRTLAVIMYGDLDISVIDSKPVGRLPIKNCVIDSSERTKAYKHIQSELDKGHQAYIVCPMVESDDEAEVDLEDVVDYSGTIKKALGANYSVEYIHGRMHQNEKDAIMDKFYKGDIDILVATTVIEVGVDVPNATVMMIENAERFGLATLHQLRGRIGRGDQQSYCIFVKTTDSESAAKRLDIVNHSNDGFYIASEDLKLRGPGELFGLSQSGDFRFDIADAATDDKTLHEAMDACHDLIQDGISISTEEKTRLDKRVDTYSIRLQNRMNI